MKLVKLDLTLKQAIEVQSQIRYLDDLPRNSLENKAISRLKQKIASAIVTATQQPLL